jgi:hypothetical protein
MRIGFQKLVIDRLLLIMGSRVVVRIALLNRLFGDTSQEQTSHADYTSMSAVFHRRRSEVGMFVTSNQLIAFAKLTGYVDSIFLTTGFSADPAMLESRRSRRRIKT